MAGCFSQTMLPHQWDTGTTSPRVCCKTGSSHIQSWDAGNTPLVGDGTLIGRGHDRYPNECRMGALAVLHPGVPVMWHTHIRDRSPIAEAVREAAYPR